MYRIDGKGEEYELLADAAQDAELLHAETGREWTVRGGDGSEAYVSKGPPE